MDHGKQTLYLPKFGFINGVDNVNWPPYRDSKRAQAQSINWDSLKLNLKVSTGTPGYLKPKSF